MEYKKGILPTWKIILNSQLANYRWGGLHEFAAVAASMGYPLFEWNGRIYGIVENKAYDTGWTAEEIK